MSAGIEVRRADERFASRSSWADSRYCFSFGDHYDPANIGHGRLLVNNEETVASGRGFDDHPHRNAEIVTWVLSGSLVHADSRGNSGLVYPGLAQRMSAGAGIRHAERNDAFRLHPDQPQTPVHFVQMWLQPDEPDVTPSYQQRELSLADLGSGWLPVASGSEPDAAVTIGIAGSTLWATRLAPGQGRLLPEGALVHVFVADGEVDCEAAGTLAAGDSLRITGRAALRLTARTAAEVLVWEMAP